MPGNRQLNDMTKRKQSPSSKISKMTDIARIAGVNVSTVSRALSGNTRVGRTQRQRILKLARERGYVVNPNASNLRGYGMFLKKVLPPMKNWLQLLIASHRADGIIVIGQSTEHAAIEAAAKIYRPLVVWGGHLHSQSYCTVGSDNVGGARAAVEHLIHSGR